MVEGGAGVDISWTTRLKEALVHCSKNSENGWYFNFVVCNIEVSMSQSMEE